MQEPLGQILPETKFGRRLMELARTCNTIVEIGTWHGQGSTRCLSNGLVRPDQRMFSLDSSAAMIAEASAAYDDPRITFIHGAVITEDDMDITRCPADPDRQKLFLDELRSLRDVPFVLDQLPEKIDLLLLDGGEYTSYAERLKLESRCSIIALDDILCSVAWKNFQNHVHFRESKWIQLNYEWNDRNGWSIFKRP